jgi:response regulator RpfG family c-di-GMP phosphodiesterase
MMERERSTTTSTSSSAWPGSPFESDPGPQETAGTLIDEQSSGSDTEAILFALAQAVEQRDPHTARHCERLAFVSVALGMALHLDRTSLSALYRGGYLHDIGKVGIPDAILFKPGKLTAEEWLVMRTHPARGEEICCHLKSLHPVLPIIRHHHERWDGAGYPDGLRGTQIPLMARVLQIADIYDALTSPRPYKSAYPVKQALHIIEKETQAGWRDPEIVKLFFQLHGDVITRIDEYTSKPDGRFEAMRAALGKMDAVLSSSDFPAPRGRRPSLPLRSARPGDSPWAAKDMWRTE